MIDISPYSPADWEGIEKAHDAARMQELTLAGLEEAFLPLSVAAEREDLFAYQVYVARKDGEVVGFAAFTQEELAWLYVHPDFQGQGIGRALAEFALSCMAPGEQTVEVLQGNEPARRLYRSIGFSEDTLVHGHMPGNEAFEVSVWQMYRKQKTT